MSTGPKTEPGLLQESESLKGDESQSALDYLSLEVSKLSSSPDSCLMETYTEEDTPSLHCSTSLIATVKHAQSPLKLLSLINQQCERLLNQSEDKEQGQSSFMSSDCGDSTITLTPTSVKHFQDSAQALNPEQHCIKSDNQPDTDCSPEDTDVCPVKAEASENMETVQPEKRGDIVDVPETSELKFNVALDWTEECLSTQCSFYDFLPEAPLSKEPGINDDLNDTEPLLHLDHNANICLNPDEALEGSLESCEHPSGVQVNTASTCEDSTEETPKPSAENGLTHCTSLEKDNNVQGSTRRSKRRKQPCPSRSASTQDPDFQGVAFRMDPELDESKEQCRLLITSKYSPALPKNVKRTRLRTRTSQKFHKTSSDEDSDSATSDTKSKLCASCCTSKTPMWRDAEDGTPLCNACGIRYKKYRVRCINCWHIPKKDGNAVSRCSKCGHFVRLTLAQRRPPV